MRKLDRIDRMILEILQKQGRIAISELAAMVNLSTTPCSERVKRLERDGIIMGYHARLSPELLDNRVLVFLKLSFLQNQAMCSNKLHEIWQIFLKF